MQVTVCMRQRAPYFFFYADGHEEGVSRLTQRFSINGPFEGSDTDLVNRKKYGWANTFER